MKKNKSPNDRVIHHDKDGHPVIYRNINGQLVLDLTYDDWIREARRRKAMKSKKKPSLRRKTRST